jgi:hypothetical protein
MNRNAMHQAPAVKPPAQPAPAPLSAEAATGTVDELIRLAGRLVGMMDQETALLDQMKVAAIADGQAEKDRLARQFESRLRALAADRAALKALAPALREEFGRAMAGFRTSLAANERALRAARDANERVVKAIVDAAQAQAAPRHAYSAAGTLGGSNGRDRAAPTPIALDRRF